MATRLLITSEQAFCLRSCSVASAFVIAPLLMAFLPPAFIDFIGGSMMFRETGLRIMFGKETKVKAKPAKTIVKAY